tara:strand:+ start:1145 stop:1444 length:300 start_codon:yes stop_codon:yes gene_type:complete
MAINEKHKIPSPTEVKQAPQSFSKEEIEQIKTLRQNLNKNTVQFGQLFINKLKLEEAENNLKQQLVDLEKNEIDLAETLSKKYGKGSINLETGTFTPSE